MWAALQLMLYLAAVAGVIAGSLGFIFFLGGALNRARDPAHRRRRGLYAALCLLAVFVSAALGFVGVAWIMYLAQQV
ncbi:MAG: hypothetical protein AB7P07_12285 [Hyphomonadaceae bacterium]